MNENTLQGKVIVITGATSGFGKGAALKFARDGASLVLAARRDRLLDEVAAACEKAGGSALAVPTDVSVREDVEELTRVTLGQFGRIDVWINNAGAGVVGRFMESPLEDHVQTIETNLLGTLYGSYFAMGQFEQQNHGILINVASVVGKVPQPYYASYVAAKHGVVGLSASLRQELKANKIDTIHVCVLLPAAFDTPFFEHVANYSGHEFEASPPVYDPEEVVEALYRLAIEPKDEVKAGTMSKVAILAHKIAPGLVESKMAKDQKKAIEKAPPQRETDGSLMEPSPTGTGVRGSKKRS